MQKKLYALTISTRWQWFHEGLLYQI